MILLLCFLLSVVVPATAQVTVSPDPPVAGSDLVITVPEEFNDGVVSVASPFGKFRVELQLPEEGKSVTVRLPGNIPVVMIGLMEGDLIEVPHKAYPVVSRSGEKNKRQDFWLAFLNAGLPSPFPLPDPDLNKALTHARAAVDNEPEYLVARDLLWRIEALKAQQGGTTDDFLKRMDQELSADPQDRLAMSAAAVHQMLGDTAGASALESIYKEQIQRTRSGESERWTEIIGTRSIESKIQKLHTWLADDPITSYAAMAFQLLAPSYLMTGDYRSTALYGLLSLKVTPSDAMTLNGVALAMAEGQFQLERGLRLADQAYNVLSGSGNLRKPGGMSETQWKVILEDAQASTLDTKAWLLARLKRWEDAEKTFNDALRIVEKDEFYLHYGIMLMEKGDKGRALDKLKRGLRISGPKRHEIRELIRTLEQ